MEQLQRVSDFLPGVDLGLDHISHILNSELVAAPNLNGRGEHLGWSPMM
jgi:hypothetical protein